MTQRGHVLIVGLNPDQLDFSSPQYSFVPGLSAESVRAGLDEAANELSQQGYQVQQCLLDADDSAIVVLQNQLQRQSFDCVLVGAGIRVAERNFLLFEQLINVIHRYAPGAAICFNRKPDDSAESVRRWL